MTVNEQDEFPQVLDAVQVTVVVPTAKMVPEAGLQSTLAVGVPVDDGVE